MTVLMMYDSSIMKPNRIIGGPHIIAGAKRDVLEFEFDPTTNTLEEIDNVFSNYRKTQKLYTKPSMNSNNINPIGTGYCIYIPAELVTREIVQKPGELLPPEEETVIIVKLAQLTWNEYQEFLQNPTSWHQPEL